LLKENGFNSKNIELLTCRTGYGCAAQDLANATGANVKAPLFNVNIIEGISGVPQVRDPISGELRKPGEFISVYKPKIKENGILDLYTAVP
jgi:hypothetical protein